MPEGRTAQDKLKSRRAASWHPLLTDSEFVSREGFARHGKRSSSDVRLFRPSALPNAGAVCSPEFQLVRSLPFAKDFDAEYDAKLTPSRKAKHIFSRH